MYDGEGVGPVNFKRTFLISFSFILLVGIPQAYSADEEKYHEQFHECDKQLLAATEITVSNVEQLTKLCRSAADNGVWQAQLYLAGLYQMGKNGKIKSFNFNEEAHDKSKIS